MFRGGGENGGLMAQPAAQSGVVRVDSATGYSYNTSNMVRNTISAITVSQAYSIAGAGGWVWL